jgi:hypothetical protein
MRVQCEHSEGNNKGKVSLSIYDDRLEQSVAGPLNRGVQKDGG